MNVTTTSFTPETVPSVSEGREQTRVRRGLLGCGTGFTVALDASGKLHYVGDNRWGQRDALAWQNMLAVYCGADYILGLCRDGAVRSAGRSRMYHIDVGSWASVSTIACGRRHAAALVANGQVLSTGDNRFGQCATKSWRDVVDVCCGKNFTAGLRQDGSILVAGGHRSLRHATEAFPRVTGLFADTDGHHVYGITADGGRLVSTAHLPNAARHWRHLVYVAVSAKGIIAVTSQGRLLSTHRADDFRSDRIAREMVSCAAGTNHMVALCRSGEVVAAGHNDFGQCATARWGKLFENYDAFVSQRQDDVARKKQTETQYQKRLSEAMRVQRHLSCGERLAACILADGQVNVTTGLRRVKNWRDVCALSCGTAHILALHKDGTVSADGNNVGGCCRVSEWKGVTSIVAGKYHSLGLCEDGRVLFAGWNVHGQGNVSEWRQIRLLRSTDTYTVGVAHDGKIYASGNQLPFDPQALDANEWSDLLDLAVSKYHMVGLRKDGRVVAAGAVDAHDVSGWRGVRAIAAGEGFTVGLCYGGRVLATGQNQWGQCATDKWCNVVSVSCGRTFTAALLADGRVLTAGQHMRGQSQKPGSEDVGQAVMSWEKAETTGYEPFRTEWMSDVMGLACGREHLMAVDRYGQVLAEGLDLDGQCTVASTFLLFRDIRQLDGFGIYAVTDQAVTREHTVETASKKDSIRLPAVTAGLRTTLMLSRSTARNLAGLVGQGLIHRAYLTKEGHLHFDSEDHRFDLDSHHRSVYRWVSSGLYHCMAVTAQGTLAGFGLGADNRSALLLEEMSRQAKEENQSEDTTWQSVVCGGEHIVALRSDGCVFATGQNRHGECRTETWQSVVSIACGERHTVALTQNGTALATGDNEAGQCNVEGWGDLVMVACGTGHTVGLKKDGTLVACGDDRMGQCRVRLARNVMYVACLPEATLCVKENGRVEMIGGTGELREALSELRHIVAVYTCEYRISALTVDGKLLQIR
ncbi:MAG: hypothetical protein J6D87_09165 [Clostridia bacterium]|nr:hypothetical protein [Clostridia bacterium]